MKNLIFVYLSLDGCKIVKNLVLQRDDILSRFGLIGFLFAFKFSIKGQYRELLLHSFHKYSVFPLNLFADNWGLS